MICTQRVRAERGISLSSLEKIRKMKTAFDAKLL